MTESRKFSATPSAKLLLAVAALLAAVVLYQVAEFFMGLACAELAVAQATEVGATGPNNLEAHLTQAKSVSDALKEKNIFAPRPPKQNPVGEVLGILGDEALINDEWYKAGDSVGDAKILAVEPTKIRVSWNGQEQELSPLGASGGGAGGGPPSGPAPPTGPRRPGRRAADGPAPGRRRAEGPRGVAPGEMAAMQERFREASAEERAKLREEMRARVAAPRR